MSYAAKRVRIQIRLSSNCITKGMDARLIFLALASSPEGWNDRVNCLVCQQIKSNQRPTQADRRNQLKNQSAGTHTQSTQTSSGVIVQLLVEGRLLTPQVTSCRNE